MTATAGHNTKVQLSSNGTSYVEAAGIDSADLNDEVNLLDVTSFKDSNIHKRIVGLQDHTLSLSGKFEVDATAQGLLRSLARAGSPIYWRVLFDGTNGYGVSSAGDGDLVKSFKLSAKVDGTVDFTAEISANAAIEEVGTAD